MGNYLCITQFQIWTLDEILNFTYCKGNFLLKDLYLVLLESNTELLMKVNKLIF